MTLALDARQLVRWLGVEGARVGLAQSKKVTLEILRATAQPLGISMSEKATRQQLIDEIIKVAGRRIDKPMRELFEMEQQALIDYFESIEVEPAEILDVLKELDVSPHRKEGRRNLLEFAARQLSETGRFMRIAGKHQDGVSTGASTAKRQRSE